MIAGILDAADAMLATVIENIEAAIHRAFAIMLAMSEFLLWLLLLAALFL